MVPFYTTKITTAVLTLSLITGRGIVGSVQAYDAMHETSNQGSVVETLEETESPEATSTSETKQESKISKIDVDGGTKVLATEEPTPEPTPEATADTSQSSSSSNKTNTSGSGSSGNNGGGNGGNTQSTTPTQPQTQPAQPAQPAAPVSTPVPSTPEPEPEQGDGYYSDQKSCMAAARSIGATNYSCSGPLDDGQWYLWWSK